MIVIKNKRCSQEKLLKECPGAIIIDVISKGERECQKLSPFFPHSGIPVPFSDGITSMSVEGNWQGLKVVQINPKKYKVGIIPYIFYDYSNITRIAEKYTIFELWKGNFQ